MSASWRTIRKGTPSWGQRTLCRAWAWLLGSLLVLLTAMPLAAATPPPVQVYFVPVPEDDAFSALKAIFPGSALCQAGATPEVAAPIITYNSISVLAAGTILTYDHWEDGYEIDLSNPVQPTTEIWGDGAPSNGAPPGIPGDLLDANTVIVLGQAVDPATRQTVLDYDGGDRFGASRSVAFTRAIWASGSRTLLAGAIEVYPVDRWGATFRAPVGVNTPAADSFSYTALAVMAAEPDTLVQFDLDADGSFESQITLGKGEGYLTPGTVREGGRAVASGPVQVTLITGDICDNYESRWFVLFPEAQWSDRYYSPVSTIDGDLTVAYLHNPYTTTLTVTRATLGGGLLTTTVPAGATAAVAVPSTSGARFASTDQRPFVAIAAVDAGGAFNSSADWGFTLVPEEQLTAQTLIGWGAGRDPESLVNPTENGSPVWVIPVFGHGNGSTVDICVDYKGDNLGPLTDANGFRYDLRLSLQEFQSAKIFDPSGDQTGMLLYVCPEIAGEPVTARLAAAWGQDPAIASPGQPGLDLGTTAPPVLTFEAGKSAELILDRDGDGRVDGGDRVRYRVIIRNSSRVPIAGVRISDTIPLYTAYVTGTTTVDNGSGTVAVSDNGVGTPFPLDEGGIPLGTLATRGSITVTFDVDVDDPLPPGLDRIRNVAVVRAGDEESRPSVETPLDYNPALALTKFTNGVRASEPPGVYIRAGDAVTWTYLVTNTGPVSVTLVVSDDRTGVIPAPVDDSVVLPAVLEPGESLLYAASGIAVTGPYSNTGSAVGVAADGDVVTATDVSHAYGVTSGLEIAKTPSVEKAGGDVPVTYTFAVSNTGNGPLGNVSVTDDRCAPVTPVLDGPDNSGDDNGNGALDPGEVWLFTCATLVSRGTTVNTGTANATDVLGEPVTATTTATVTSLTSAVALSKTAGSELARIGTPVAYTVTATNTGEDRLTSVVVNDDRCTLAYVGGDEGLPAVMEPGEAWTFTCSAVISETTVNVATVGALDSFGDPVSATASAQVFGVMTDLALRKLPSVEKASGDEPVTYTFAVSTTGNGPVTDLTVVDDRCAPVIPLMDAGGNIGDLNSDDALNPGEVWQFTCATLVSRGTTVNVGTASGIDVLGELITATATATVTSRVAAVQLNKVASRESVLAGTTVVYSVTAANSGEDRLRDVVVNDDRCDLTYVAGDAGITGVMEPGEAWTYVCSAVITGTTVNIATVGAVDSFGDPVSATASAQVVVPRQALPLLLNSEPEAPCPPPDGCPLGAEVKALAVHRARGIVYVATRNPDGLLALEQRTLRVLAQAATGGRPWGLAVNELTNRVYLSRFDGGDVQVFDAETLALLQTIPVGTNPSQMAILPELDTVFVLVRSGSRVAIIRGTSLAQDISSGGSGPLGIAADAENTRVFISHRDSASMSMLRRVGESWQAFPGPLFEDGRQLFGLAYAPPLNRLFVLYAGTDDAWFLDVWEPNDDSLWGRFSTQGMPSAGTVASPNVGGLGLAFNPATGRLFVANTGAASLSVLDGTTLGVVQTIGLGQDPFAVAINSGQGLVFVGLRGPGRLVKLVDGP